MAAVTRAAMGILRTRPDLRDGLWARVRHAEALLAPLGGQIAGSQIVPVIVGPDERTMQLAGLLQAAGFDVRGIRPPTVPNGTARLRISITNNASLTDIDGLAAALAAALSEAAAGR
jgi:8-amino-7-oxononanoate synthase